jgi:hypothetical protein
MVKILITFVFGVALAVYVSGCGFKMVYMLDQPVSDPIMYADDAQDSDLCRVEDGGYSGSAGECPT